MAEATIVITNEQAARVYNSASESEKEEIRGLVTAQLLDYAQRRHELAVKNLLALMGEISAKAKARGLTPEILEDLLRDE